MKKTLGFATAAVFGVLAFPGLAAAQNAFATTDLNVRAGPGPGHEVVAVIPNDQAVTIHGCLDGSKWCEVSWSNNTGWAYSDYLAYDVDGNRVIVAEAGPQITTPTVTYDAGTTGSIAGTVGGATAGALIGGPVGAVVGGVAGATLGAAIDPPQQVRSYVVQQPVHPIYLDGEVVVGAGIPDTVTLHTVPDYEYRFAAVNNQRVLVDPTTRQVVYIVR